jgi:hypothetical protein
LNRGIKNHIIFRMRVGDDLKADNISKQWSCVQDGKSALKDWRQSYLEEICLTSRSCFMARRVSLSGMTVPAVKQASLLRLK